MNSTLLHCLFEFRSYYNSLRVFNLLQNEDLELYPKR